MADAVWKRLNLRFSRHMATASSTYLSQSTKEKIRLISCRACATAFEYRCSNGQSVKIFVGSPSSDVEYKAMSHVWSAHRTLNLQCTNCSSAYSPRLHNPSPFRRMMDLAGPGSTVWLDSLSISQKDHCRHHDTNRCHGETYIARRRPSQFFFPLRMPRRITGFLD